MIFIYFISNFINIIILLDPSNMQQKITTIENIIMYFIIISLIISNNLYINSNFIFLFLFYFVNIFFISLLVENYGAIDRYKFPTEISIFLIVIIFSYNKKITNNK